MSSIQSSGSSSSDDNDKAAIIYNRGSLTFANQKVAQIPDVLWKLYSSKTHRLDLSYNFLNTLKSVEKFYSLVELILDNNLISERENFSFMPSLKYLSLNNNRIHDLQEFVRKANNNFPNLTFLSLLRNAACPDMLINTEHDEHDYQRYRYYVLHFLQKLKFLDSTPVRAEELREAFRIGHLLHTRKPRILTEEEDRTLGSEAVDLIQDNLVSDAPLKHRGAYIRGEFCFTNKESEGNRFILNQDL